MEEIKAHIRPSVWSRKKKMKNAKGRGTRKRTERKGDLWKALKPSGEEAERKGCERRESNMESYRRMIFRVELIYY